jgi:hypothetical protein
MAGAPWWLSLGLAGVVVAVIHVAARRDTLS